MLNISIQSLLIHSLWCSRRIRDDVCETLLSSTDRQEHRFETLLASELRQHGNEHWRCDEYQRLAKDHFQYASFLKSGFLKLFHHFFVQDGMFIHARRGELAECADFFRYLHPYILIASYMADELRAYSDSAEASIKIQHVEELSENILENGLEHCHKMQYAENHCHVGGVDDCNVALFALLEERDIIHKTISFPSMLWGSQEDTYEKDRTLFLWSFALVNEWLMERLDSHDKKDLSNESSSRLKHYLCCLERFLKFQVPFDFRDILDMKGLETIVGKRIAISPVRILLQRCMKQAQAKHYDSALLLYLTAVFHKLNNEENAQTVVSRIKNVISLFLMQLNIMRSEMVMARGNGLKDFNSFYGSSFRRSGKELQNQARALFMSGITSAECRSTHLPTKSMLQSILSEVDRTLEHHYREIWLGDKCMGNSTIVHPAQQILRFSFGYHFTKKNSFYDIQIQQNRKDTKKFVKFLRKESNNIKMKEILLGRMLRSPVDERIANLCFDLRLALRTLDAAGDENSAAPEIYASDVKRIRNTSMKISTCNGIHKCFRKISLAFHAGEDFSHIVTGMRRVHETMEFLHYERNDRLGHALAIGISPKEWMLSKREVLLTYEEHFDNCLWLYQIARKLLELTGNFIHMVNFYHDKIIRLIDELDKCRLDVASGDTDDVDSMVGRIDDYWKAYRRREFLWESNDERNLGGKYVDNRLNQAVENISKSYRLRHSDKYSKMGYNHSIWFDTITLRYGVGGSCIDGQNALCRYEAVTEEELDFWEAVQDYLIDLCAQREIVIEANPSSNVTISEIDSYRKHPIFRWCPVDEKDLSPKGKYNKWGIRKGRVGVCVNSDDPGIFITTLQNEFRLIREAAIETYPASMVDHWIETLRKKGMEVFEENYICPFN